MTSHDVFLLTGRTDHPPATGKQFGRQSSPGDAAAVSSSLRRGTLAATALALTVATLSACGAGNDAATTQIKPDNAAKTEGSIKLQNVNIVTASDDTTETRTKGPATIAARIFNDGQKDEVLKGITVEDSGVKAKLSPAEGEKELTVPAGGSLKLGGKNEAAALLADARKAGVLDGNAQSVTFDLSSTGSVTLRATVVPSRHHFKTVGPTVKPSAPAEGGTSSEQPGAASSGEGKAPGAEKGEQAGREAPKSSESAEEGAAAGR